MGSDKRNGPTRAGHSRRLKKHLEQYPSTLPVAHLQGATDGEPAFLTD